VTPVLQKDRLEHHGDEWVEAGLISETQLASLRHFEHLDEIEVRRFSVASEVAAYLGSVLTLMGGALVMGRTWDEITFGGRLAIAAVIAVVGLVSGGWLYRQGEPGTDRLGGFLTLVGIGGVAFLAGLSIDRFDPGREEVVPLGIGLVVLPTGLLLWRNRSRPLELLAAVVGYGTAVTAGVSLADVGVWVGGIMVLAVGAALAVAGALAIARPGVIVIAIGAVTAFLGGFMLSEGNRHLGPVAALAVAIVLVSYAIRTDVVPLLVLGLIGALIATEALLATTFSGAFSSLIVTGIGLAIVITVIVRTRHAPT